MRRPARSRGFAYLAVLFFVATLGIALAAAGELWSTAERRERERELLFVGAEYRRAIALYHQRTPGVARQYPQRLEELLEDRRQPVPQRYLRRLYRDPITGSADWGLVRDEHGGIRGVHSRSGAAPLKTGNFRPADREFEGRGAYSEWVFQHAPRRAPGREAAPQPAPPASAR
ncbi:type II secretion system protein [Caldimonas tepidiphila]|uniref:type II secretion system protein n=1 Tax=Caldimonas tepidiphila TaxID=2315841 RepID=UPI000E5A79E1|nr:type II secretion system protein [Caldimonas tepidiphila]